MRCWISFIGKAIVATTLVTTLSCCSWGPVAAVTSLSPAIQTDTVRYNDAVGDAADSILLENVLEARDLQPLNLSQLSSLSGALSLQGTLGFTIPWGTAVQQGNPVEAQNSSSPSIMGSTTPTYTLAPLNTQAFTLSILQPVSPNYVLSLWQSGLPRELLLALFVKEIDFPKVDVEQTLPASTLRYLNDPDEDQYFDAFMNLVHTLVTANAALKAVDVLDPIGPAFSLYASVSKTVSGVTTMNQTTNADNEGFGLITGSNDGQYHVGNADPNPVANGGQLYRVYPGQVELCVDPTIMEAAHQSVPDIAPSLPTIKNQSLVSKEVQLNTLFLALTAGPGSSGSQPQGGGGGASKGSSSQGAPASASGGSTQGMTAALQAGRVSPLVSNVGCRPDEVVLKKFTEEEFQIASESFVHIEWRSVSEMFAYLGAVLRYNERHKDPYTVSISQDSSIATAPADQSVDTSSVLFSVKQNGSGRLGVRYNGKYYAVNDVKPNEPNADLTKVILSILSTLVNFSSQPATANSSAPLRLLPIP